MKLPNYQVVFEEDSGSLCDIYVLNSSLSDWQNLINFLKAGPYSIEFFIGEEKQEKLPDKSIDLFNDPERVSRLIKVYIGDLILHNHCFAGNEIEFDLAPEEVIDQTIADSVYLFMERLAKTLKRPVILTPENSSDIVLVEYNMDGMLSMVRSFYVP